MKKKLVALAATLVLITLLATPLVLAQQDENEFLTPAEGSSAPPLPIDPNYIVPISGDQQVYCGVGVVGDPITEWCIRNGVTPPVMYNQDGTLAGFQQYAGSQGLEPAPVKGP